MTRLLRLGVLDATASALTPSTGSQTITNQWSAGGRSSSLPTGYRNPSPVPKRERESRTARWVTWVGFGFTRGVGGWLQRKGEVDFQVDFLRYRNGRVVIWDSGWAK